MFGVFRCLLLRIHGETSEWAAWIVPLEAKTLTWGYSHDLSTQTSPICTCLTFGFLYTSGISCHCGCVATSCVLTNLLSLYMSLLGASTTRSASRSRWFVGKVRGNSLRFKFLLPRDDPSSSFWSLIVYSKQKASKCSEHNRLNARQSENFTEFLLKAFSKLLKSIKCFFSDVKRSYSKIILFFSWRNIRAWAYYKMAISCHLKQFGANRIV